MNEELDLFTKTATLRLVQMGMHVTEDGKGWTDVNEALGKVTFIKNEHVPCITVDMFTVDEQSDRLSSWLYIDGVPIARCPDLEDVYDDDLSLEKIDSMVGAAKEYARKRNFQFKNNTLALREEIAGWGDQ
jgi:hypothetical protein